MEAKLENVSVDGDVVHLKGADAWPIQITLPSLFRAAAGDVLQLSVGRSAPIPKGEECQLNGTVVSNSGQAVVVSHGGLLMRLEGSFPFLEDEHVVTTVAIKKERPRRSKRSRT